MFVLYECERECNREGKLFGRTNKKEKEKKGTKLKQLFDVNVGLKSVRSYAVSVAVCSLLLSAFFLYLLVCGLRIKLETWQCIYREQPSPLCPLSVGSPCSAVLLARRLLLLPLGQSITLQVGNKVVKTNGLRDKMRLLKLHVCKLTCCVTVCVCVCASLWVYGCSSVLVYLALPANQNGS